MNLVTRFLAARRDKLLMKAGCWLVCFSLVLGQTVFPYRKRYSEAYDSYKRKRK